jgi:hypothetical protein
MSSKAFKRFGSALFLSNNGPVYILIYCRHSFNVENVNLQGYKWNETVSNRICNVSNEICNTCATSYVTADNSKTYDVSYIKSYM